MKAVRYFCFSRNEYERVWLDDEHTTCTYRVVDEHLYEVELVNEELLKVTRDGVSKIVLVRPEYDDYVYRCKKTFILARYRAKGLFDTLARCINDDGRVWNSATLYTVCDHIVNDMKPAPKRPEMTMNRSRLLDSLEWSASHKGVGVDVACGWLAYAEYAAGLSYAEIYNTETRHRITFPITGDFTKKQFLMMAADYLADKYEDLARSAA